jgi:hypothetical protein
MISSPVRVSKMMIEESLKLTTKFSPVGERGLMQVGEGRPSRLIEWMRV